MQRRRPLGTTYHGLTLLLISGGISGAIVSASMFLFRAQCEPVLRFLLPFVARRATHYRYNPDSYYFFAWVAVALTLLWIILTGVGLLRKPAEDRRIDAIVRLKGRSMARGAPLEP